MAIPMWFLGRIFSVAGGAVIAIMLEERKN